MFQFKLIEFLLAFDAENQVSTPGTGSRYCSVRRDLLLKSVEQQNKGLLNQYRYQDHYVKRNAVYYWHKSLYTRADERRTEVD